jgi:large subunit ribosomal protein L17
MRHMNLGRKLNRSTPHRLSMFRNMASSLILTEGEYDADDKNAPKVKGRIVTTIEKAKEVRRLVEKVITLAKRTLPKSEAAAEFLPVKHKPGTLEFNAWRASKAGKDWKNSPEWNKWAAEMGPVVAARRKAVQMLGEGNKKAVRILFDELAPRFKDRNGGYTRVLRLAKPRQGDAGTRAILEFTGVRDRVRGKAEKPAFDEGGEKEKQD